MPTCGAGPPSAAGMTATWTGASSVSGTSSVTSVPVACTSQTSSSAGTTVG